MAELADAHGSGPCGSNTMRVQVSFPALDKEGLLDNRYPKAFSDIRKSKSKPVSWITRTANMDCDPRCSACYHY